MGKQGKLSFVKFAGQSFQESLGVPLSVASLDDSQIAHRICLPTNACDMMF